MNDLSGAASIIAVIDLSAKITVFCSQYITDVKDAKNEIECIEKKVGDIKHIVEGIKKLLDGLHKSQLSTTHGLFKSLEQCLQQLQQLKEQLEPREICEATSRSGVRALEWPLTSKQVKDTLSTLEAYEQSFTQALQVVDHTNLLLDSNQKLDLTAFHDKETWLQEFQKVVGSIVVLENPLSIASLACLLQVPQEHIKCQLDSLHSVLNVPDSEDVPIRLLHSSFREFLVDPQKQGKSSFWVDERSTHESLASYCLELMSGPSGLHQDMCSLSAPGVLRDEIDEATVAASLSPSLRYACCYWITHLEHGKQKIVNGGPTQLFLQKHLLHWLEAMSLMRESGTCDLLLGRLLKLADSSANNMLDFLLDARQFVLRFQSVLIDAPLQIYCSALVFAPRRSLVRRTFADQVRQEVDMLSKREKDWDTLGRSLTPYYDPVTAVAFSPDGHLVASGAQDHRVQLWEVAKGKWRRTLGSHSDYVAAVAFSPDGQLVTSGADDSMIQVCEVATGICRNTLYASDWVGAVTFSPDGQLIASGSDDNTVQVWELVTGMCCSTLEGHSGRVTAVAFSSDGQLIVSGSEDQTAQVWDVVTGKCRSTVDTHSKVTAVALSPDGQLIVSASKDQTAQVWDAVTGTCRSTVATHSALVTTVALSSDSQILHTNIGDFQVSSFSPIPSPSGQRKQSPNILVQGQWVLRNQERFLWLPSENSIWAVAVREDIVCLGLQSGRVVLLRIH